MSKDVNLANEFENLKRKRELENANKAIKKKVKNVVHELVVDKTTGEVLGENTTSQTIVSKGAEPTFIKLYIDDLILLNDLPTKSSAILWELIKGMTYDNEIVLNSYKKNKIIETLNIKLSTLNNALSSFVKKEILYRVGTGTFLPNQYLFAKGSWEDISDLRMIVKYKAGKKEIELQVNGKNVSEYNNENNSLQDFQPDYDAALRRLD